MQALEAQVQRSLGTYKDCSFVPRGAGCLGEPGCGKAPAAVTEGERARVRKRARLLPPPGCVTSGSFLPFLGLSVSICKMDMVLSLEVMGG